MNIHPILVHFPIAILTIYALLELARFKKLQQAVWYWYTKAFMAIVGTVASYAAFASGDEEGGRAITDPLTKQAFHLHENWATITLVIFSVILFYHLVTVLSRNQAVVVWFAKASWSRSLWQLLAGLSSFIGNPIVILLLALAGLVSITITGGLGGSLVYGQNADPVVSLIYKLFLGQ